MKRALTGALLLGAGLAVSACAPGSAYAYNGYFGYPYDCAYDPGDACGPFVDGYGDFHRFDHFNGHPMHVGHGFGGFGGHGFAGRGGFGFGGHGGGGHR